MKRKKAVGGRLRPLDSLDFFAFFGFFSLSIEAALFLISRRKTEITESRRYNFPSVSLIKTYFSAGFVDSTAFSTT